MELSRAVGALVMTWLALLGCAQGVTLEVREGNTTCIKAELSALFSITYNTSSSSRTVSVPLPNSSTVDARSSSCGAAGSLSWLVAVFGSGHALGLSFSTNGSLYNVVNMTLQYNLSDSTIFPDANISDVVTVVSASVGISAAVNTTYRCVSPTSVRLGEDSVTFTDMKLEAYMPGNNLSSAETVCGADHALTPVPPAPPQTTTVPTPTPAPTPPGKPERGSYFIHNSSGTVCLLAQMALQLNISYFSLSQNKPVQQLFNLIPNLTLASGSCMGNSASLSLTQEQTITLNFTFTLNSTSNRYHLSGINLLASWPDMTAPTSTGNSSLDYLRSKLGRSYMCNAEQTLLVAPNFSLNTFRLQVQPFGVTTNQFATAEECQMDQDQMLIPIIVGAALAGLVLIVLIAYLIGRKRSHAGYQTI